LAGELLHFLLQRLEQLPSATFRESELASVSTSQFRSLARQGLLVYQQKDPEQQRFPCPTPCEVACDRVVGQVGGKTVAICEVWPEVVNVPLSAADLAVYAFGMDHFLDCFREANGMTGSFGLLSDRLFRIGERRIGQVTTEVFLCLVNEASRAEAVLATVQGHRLDGGRALCIFPSFAVTDPLQVQKWGHEQIGLATFSEAVKLPTLQINLSVVERQPGIKARASYPARTPAEERDYGNHQLAYLCQDRLHFSGTWQARRHTIRMNETERQLADHLTRLLVRLVIELKKGRGGWVSTGVLERENIVVGRTVHQAVSDLRKALLGALLDDVDGTKLIQNDGKRRYRLSTHPNYVYPPQAGLPGSQDWFVLTLNNLKKAGVKAREKRAVQQKRWAQRPGPSARP